MKLPTRMFKSNKKGFILMTSYLALSVVSVFSIALFSRQASFLQAGERNKNKIISFQMAEAGTDLAIANLPSNISYPGSNGYVGMNTGNLQGGYSVTVCPPTCPGMAPPTDPMVRMIQANGQAPGNSNILRGYETRSITTYVTLQPPHYFNYAVFAKDSIDINGNPGTLVDSYDSRLGPYLLGTNSGYNGTIGTDSIAASTVDLIGNVHVHGDGIVGPGGNPATVVTFSGNAQITGGLYAAPNPSDYAPPTTGAVSLGALTVNGGTYYLGTGTYRFSSINIQGNGKVQAMGPVKVYVDGSVSIAGNGIGTVDNKPPNFLLFVTGTSSVSINGNGSLYAGIYAPRSDVSNTGNGELYGAVVAKTYQQSNGKVHFDEALKEIVGDSNYKVRVLSWREQNTTASI